MPRDTSSLPTYTPAIERDLALAALNNRHAPLPPLNSNTAVNSTLTASTKAKAVPKKKPAVVRKKKSVTSNITDTADADSAIPTQSTKFRPEESDTLLDIIEDLKPIGKAEWEKSRRTVSATWCIVTSLRCRVWLTYIALKSV